MLGNVWEWCEDLHSNSNLGPYLGPYRVVRGGSLGDDKNCRSSLRAGVPPSDRDVIIGFRLCRELNS